MAASAIPRCASFGDRLRRLDQLDLLRDSFASFPIAPLHGHPRPAARVDCTGRRGSSGASAEAAGAPGGARCAAPPPRTPSAPSRRGSRAPRVAPLRVAPLRVAPLRVAPLRWRLGGWHLCRRRGDDRLVLDRRHRRRRRRRRRRDVLDDLFPHCRRRASLLEAAHGKRLNLPPGEVLDQRDEQPADRHHEDDQRGSRSANPTTTASKTRKPASSTNLGPTAAGMRLEG